MAGRYRHRGVVAMRRAGTTLRPLGKAHVTIDGAIWVLPGAKGARITGLTLTSHDPVYSIPLKIQADDVSLDRKRHHGGAEHQLRADRLRIARSPTRSSSATASAAADARASSRTSST